MPVNVTIDRVCFPVVSLLVVTMIIEEIPIRGFTKKKVKTSKTGIISQADRYSVVFCHTPKFFFSNINRKDSVSRLYNYLLTCTFKWVKTYSISLNL